MSNSRRRLWRKTSSEQIRGCEGVQVSVMSYNILSDELMRSHPELYSGISWSDLAWNVRWPRILGLLSKVDADIVCLQEVAVQDTDTGIRSDVEALGYNMIYKKCTRNKNDGCAILFKCSKFVLGEIYSVEYHQPHVSFLNRNNIGLIVSLKLFGQVLYVANTHLLFNPKREDIRLAQSALLITELDRLAYRGEQEGEPRYHPMLICGDFNLTPDSDVFRFIHNGQTIITRFVLPISLGITPFCQHIDTLCGRELEFSGPPLPPLNRLYHTDVALRGGPPLSRDEFQSKISTLGKLYDANWGSLSHRLALRSVYLFLDSEVSLVSTYQNGWKMVDYIFYNASSELKNISYLSLPSVSEMDNLRLRLPTPEDPSDHFHLVAKFWLSNKSC